MEKQVCPLGGLTSICYSITPEQRESWGKMFLNIVELGGWERYNLLWDHHFMSKWPLAQAGIYTVGQFAKHKKNSKEEEICQYYVI